MTDTKQTNDVREGWTSASNAMADSLCPGRHLAQNGMRSTGNKYSESGSKVHAALAAYTSADKLANRPLTDRLTLEERETYDACLEIQRKLTAQTLGDLTAGRFQEYKEQRYWAKFKAGGRDYAHSGQADYVGRCGTKALIIDYKTLAGDVPHSPKNMQLRDLACLVRGTYAGTDEITVAIVQPWVTRTPELCVYSKDDLDRASREMFQRVVACNQPDAKRIAGEEQCKFCLAKSTCVQYQQWAGQMTPPAMMPLLNTPMAQWTPEQCARAAQALGPADNFITQLKQFLKDKLTADPASVPGWCLQPGAFRETIVKPQGVFERFVALGGKTEQFMPCVTIGKANLRTALNSLTGAKGRQLDAAMATLTDGCVESKQTAPSLKPIGKEKK